jgi:putative oxidoreductase
VAVQTQSQSPLSPTTSVSLALLLVRVGLSAVFMYHGAQKLFMAFGGRGLGGLTKSVGPVLAPMVGVGEFFGGLAVLLGVFSRFSAASIAVIMIGAIVMVHGKHGFGGEGGYEYNFVLLMMAAAIFLAGPGKFALAKFLPAKLKPWLE